jgi:hypothetical protein
MLYGQVAVLHQQPVPAHPLLAIDLAIDTASTAMGPPPKPYQASPSSPL